MSETTIGRFRRATDEEKRAYSCCETYDLLVGPDGFECLLTEPEDRVWFRDLKPVVELLNEQGRHIHELQQCYERSGEKVVQLRLKLIKAQKALRGFAAMLTTDEGNTKDTEEEFGLDVNEVGAMAHDNMIIAAREVLGELGEITRPGKLVSKYNATFEQWCTEFDRVVKAASGTADYTGQVDDGEGFRQSFREPYDDGVDAESAAYEEMSYWE